MLGNGLNDEKKIEDKKEVISCGTSSITTNDRKGPPSEPEFYRGRNERQTGHIES